MEWLRPVPPDYKMVGPVLAEPGKLLPAELDVEHYLAWLDQVIGGSLILY